MEHCRTAVTTERSLNESAALPVAVAAPILMLSTFLLIAFVKTKQANRNTSNFLIMFLSSTHFVYGFLMCLFFVLNRLLDTNSAKFILQASYISYGFLTFLSASIIVIIAADRYVNMNPNIERPSRFAKLFKPPRLYIY